MSVANDEKKLCSLISANIEMGDRPIKLGTNLCKSTKRNSLDGKPNLLVLPVMGSSKTLKASLSHPCGAAGGVEESCLCSSSCEVTVEHQGLISRNSNLLLLFWKQWGLIAIDCGSDRERIVSHTRFLFQ